MLPDNFVVRHARLGTFGELVETVVGEVFCQDDEYILESEDGRFMVVTLKQLMDLLG